MFKSNQNFNEYYCFMHQNKHSTKKLKIASDSTDKIKYSITSFSQDSKSDGELSLSKKKNLQDFINRRKK